MRIGDDLSACFRSSKAESELKLNVTSFGKSLVRGFDVFAKLGINPL